MGPADLLCQASVRAPLRAAISPFISIPQHLAHRNEEERKERKETDVIRIIIIKTVTAPTYSNWTGCMT